MMPYRIYDRLFCCLLFAAIPAVLYAQFDTGREPVCSSMQTIHAGSEEGHRVKAAGIGLAVCADTGLDIGYCYRDMRNHRSRFIRYLTLDRGVLSHYLESCHYKH